MKEHYEGQVTEIEAIDGTKIHNILVPVVICKEDFCLPVDLLVDTGADKSMISYKFGKELGLEAPTKKDRTLIACDANNREVHYIKRKIDLYIGNGIMKKDFIISWCTSPRVNKNFLGMDFFDHHKLIVMGGKTKRFYITKRENCVMCKS